jgi:hypothetical protein
MLIIGTAALGLGQEPPILSVIDIGQTSVTLQLTATTQNTLGGFDVLWQGESGPWHVVWFYGGYGTECGRDSLQPGQSVQVVLDGVTNGACGINLQPRAFTCDSVYRFSARLHYWNTRSTTVTLLTAPCD